MLAIFYPPTRPGARKKSMPSEDLSDHLLLNQDRRTARQVRRRRAMKACAVDAQVVMVEAQDRNRQFKRKGIEGD